MPFDSLPSSQQPAETFDFAMHECVAVQHDSVCGKVWLIGGAAPAADVAEVVEGQDPLKGRQGRQLDVGV